jgi:alanine racemase
MSIWYNHVRVDISLDKLRENYLFLSSKAGRIMPVIKSDAYGHGLGAVASCLARAGADMLAVGAVHEAAALRLVPFNGRILSLLGPADEDEMDALWEHEIIPMVHDQRTLKMLASRAVSLDRPLDVALKLDTGMARLGFNALNTASLIKALKKAPNLRPVLVCSHLAAADDENGRDYVLEQAEIFAQGCKALRFEGYDFAVSLANSAAALAYPDLRHDFSRPGIALYGDNPLAGTPMSGLGRDLHQGMQVHAPVLSVHDLPRGQSIHYGRTFTAPRDMRVAIVGVGYADNYSRGMSNAGFMAFLGGRAPIVGRVCMQMTAVDVTGLPEVAPGDRAWILGGPRRHFISAAELAGWWGTISYEIFCLLGQNQRTYHDSGE